MCIMKSFDEIDFSFGISIKTPFKQFKLLKLKLFLLKLFFDYKILIPIGKSKKFVIY